MTGERVLIVGGTGLLGTALCYQFASRGYEVAYTYRQSPLPVDNLGLDAISLDVMDPGSLQQIDPLRPSWIFHTPSLKNVDYCETHPLEAYDTNVTGTQNVARVASRLGCRLFYIGTNDIFSGDRGPFSEEDAPAPLNVYARTKLEAEARVRKIVPDHLIVRTTFHGLHYNPENSFSMRIISSLRQGKVVHMATDQVSSIISTLDLVDALERLVRIGARGTLHVACRNALSRYRFATSLANVFGLDSRLVQKTTYDQVFAELGLRATRSLKATLAVGRAEAVLRRRLPTIRESLIHMRRTAAAFTTKMGIPYGI